MKVVIIYLSHDERAKTMIELDKFSKETGIAIEPDNFLQVYDYICEEAYDVPLIKTYCKTFKEEHRAVLDYNWIKWFVVLRQYLENEGDLEDNLDLDQIYKELSAYPKHFLVETEMGNVRKMEEQYDKAIEHFLRASEEIPETGYPYYMLGALKSFSQQYEESIRYSQLAMKYSKNSENSNEVKARAMHNLGALAYQHEHDIDKAIGFVESALFVYPDYDIAKATLKFLKDIAKPALITKNKKTRKVRAKSISKLAPLSLSLKRYTKKRLIDIGEAWNIDTISRLKKDALIDILSKEMPQKFYEYMNILPKDQLECLYTMAKQEGGMNVDDYEYQSVIKAEYFESIGVMNFNDTYDCAVQMPKEIVNMCLKHEKDKESSRLGLKNQAHVDFVKGLLEHYGMISVEDLIMMAKKIGQIDIDVDKWLLIVLSFAASGDHYDVYEDYLVHWDLLDRARMARVLKRNEQFDYAPVKYEDIMKAGKDLKCPLNAQQKVIMDQVSAELNFTEALMGEIQKGLMEHIHRRDDWRFFLYDIEMEYDLNKELFDKKVLRLIRKFETCTGRFDNKGYSDSEILRSKDGVLRKAPVKIGRNEPCPCGSGKKYKRCCLRAD